jgi:uncharacterized damage-inducible protein DinB
MESTLVQNQATVISPEQFLEHWQGHRNLTRKTIEAFPEDKLFNYSIGGMRPYADLVMEMITMGAPSVRGVVAGNKWPSQDEVNKDYGKPSTKEGLLELWDKATEEIHRLWPGIPHDHFQKFNKFWDQWDGIFYTSMLYLIDNEIHHRGQGYVYLRSLGIEPPPFWERN